MKRQRGNQRKNTNNTAPPNAWGKEKDQKDVMNRFEKEREKMHASVKKHLNDVQSSSDEEDVEVNSIMDSLLQNFSRHGGQELGKTREYLNNSFQSGAEVCLICIATIKRTDAIWNCTHCYGSFHIVCIQRWAQGNIFHQKQAMEELPAFKRSTKISWGCPKCRHPYEEDEIPNRYFCYCKKSQDPPHHPWMVPHSCGETCNGLLQPECGHRCLLLCHPGPCPPCPIMVRVRCHCEQSDATARRCSDKYWACQRQCGKLLPCKKHKCSNKCHPGDCGDCTKQSMQSCDCKAEVVLRPCAEPNWKCEKICSKPFSCGHHKCEVRCHAGDCGDCHLTLARTCPCGKTTEATLSCTQEVPTCNDTCGKVMACGVHTCQLKCHKDKCACLEIVKKVCRCGQHMKELPCGKEYLCESKCKRTKMCQKHPCNRKCCDGACPPCEKPCGRTLPCGSHKCPSICHRGSCYPCPQTAVVKCRCGETSVTVPCGRERKMRAPRCNKLCKIPPDCEHPSREPHPCHMKECPPCKQICHRPRTSCAHPCNVTCHTAVLLRCDDNKQPAGPWEVTEAVYKKFNLPCPPCTISVPNTCLGQHETCDWPCSEIRPFSCGRPCGRRLRCGNHVCTLECHVVESAADREQCGSNCIDCSSDCDKPRPKDCVHECPRPCHPGPCPPCGVKVKVKCHCAVTVLFLACSQLTTNELDSNTLCCGNPCPKNYPCGHKCRDVCHAGDCSGFESCRRKVKVACPCGRIKKDMTCDVVRRGEAIVNCDSGCEEKVAEQRQAKEAEEARKKLEEDLRNKEELEKFQKKFEGKKKARDRRRNVIEDDPSFLAKYWVHITAASVAVIVVAVVTSLLTS